MNQFTPTVASLSPGMIDTLRRVDRQRTFMDHRSLNALIDRGLVKYISFESDPDMGEFSIYLPTEKGRKVLRDGG